MSKQGRRRVPAEQRFWQKINRTESCWLWTDHLNAEGYGRIRTDERKVMAHRFSWELAGNSVPEGMLLDHICRVRACVNPSHLRVATQFENMQNLSGAQSRNGTGARWCDMGSTQAEVQGICHQESQDALRRAVQHRRRSRRSREATAAFTFHAQRRRPEPSGMNSIPSEYWDYDYPDMSQPHHPAHPDYDLYHPAPAIAAVVVLAAVAIQGEGVCGMSTSMALHDDAWHRDAVDTIAALAETGHVLTADDLRKIMRPAPNSNHVGTAFRAARQLGIITAVGIRESNAPSRKGGLIRLWAATPNKEKP